MTQSRPNPQAPQARAKIEQMKRQFEQKRAISDSLSVSYNDIESRKTNDSVSEVNQDLDSISLSYTAGGMTIGILDSEAKNASYTADRKQSATAIQMSIAF